MGNNLPEAVGETSPISSVQYREVDAKKEQILHQIETGSVHSVLSMVNDEGGPSAIGYPETLARGVMNKDPDVLEMLLAMNFDYVPDEKGNTPLHIAAKMGDLGKVKILLSGCSHSLSPEDLKAHRNLKGKRPFDVVKSGVKSGDKAELSELLECTPISSSSLSSSSLSPKHVERITNALVKGACRTHHKREGVYVFSDGRTKTYFVHPPASELDSHASPLSSGKMGERMGEDNSRVFCIEFCGGRCVLTGPFEICSQIAKGHLMVYLLGDTISVDEICLYADVFLGTRIVVNDDASSASTSPELCNTFTSLVANLKRGTSVKDPEKVIARFQMESTNRRLVPSAVESSHSPSSSSHSPSSPSSSHSHISHTSSLRAVENAPATRGIRHLKFHNRIRTASADIARTHIIRQTVYYAICESVSGNWWKPNEKAIAFAFKSSSASLRVFLLQISDDGKGGKGGKDKKEGESEGISLTMSGPMADEQILKEYPEIGEVHILSNVSVDILVDIAKIVAMAHVPSKVSSIVGGIVGDNSGEFIHEITRVCTMKYGETNKIESKYLAMKFKKVASETLDSRMKPSCVGSHPVTPPVSQSSHSQNPPELKTKSRRLSRQKKNDNKKE